MSVPSSAPWPSVSAPIRSASFCGELLGDRLVHVEAVGRGAGLADVAHLGDHRALDGRVEVGVVEDQERRVAAELHRGLQHLVGGLAHQHPAHLGGAGEAELAQAGVLDDRLGDGARARSR